MSSKTNTSMLLNRKLRKVNISIDDVNLVSNVLNGSECSSCSGRLADFSTRYLVVKYAPLFKGKYSQLELANIIYAILTDKLCDVCYIVSALYDEAKARKTELSGIYPIEFYLSGALEALTLMPKGWKIFDDSEDNTDGMTVQEALEGICRKTLVFPTESNRVVAYPDTDYYLLYVQSDDRWLAIVNSHIAAQVMQFSNPVVMSNDGLLQGSTLLRFMPPLKGIVMDDYILL